MFFFSFLKKTTTTVSVSDMQGKSTCKPFNSLYRSKKIMNELLIRIELSENIVQLKAEWLRYQNSTAIDKMSESRSED